MGTRKPRNGQSKSQGKVRATKGTDRAPPSPAPVTSQGNDALDHVTSVLGGALGAGYPGARSVTATLAPDAVAAALFVCMPDEWVAEDEAQGLIHRFTNDEAAVVLAWLAAQWRDGYSAAIADLRAGRRPVTEFGP